MNLINVCEIVTISLHEFPFYDETYWLGDEELWQEFNREVGVMYSFDQPIFFCGKIVIDFFIDNRQQTPLDNEIFVVES